MEVNKKDVELRRRSVETKIIVGRNKYFVAKNVTPQAILRICILSLGKTNFNILTSLTLDLSNLQDC